MANQFQEALTRFKEFSGYVKPMSWDEWSTLRDRDTKVAVLYCQFYNEITLAWYKARADFVPDEDGLSCVLQYLTKNVPILEEDEDKFTPAYIYRVSYNCMDCLRYIQRDINRHNIEVTNVVLFEGEELDLCDLVPHRDMGYEELQDRSNFWAIIQSMGPEVEKVVNHLVNDESLRRVSKRSANYGLDPLTDISVSESRMAEIVEMLKERLSQFKPVYY